MEWTDELKEIIGKLRESGKGKQEIETIIMRASDKATIGREMEYICNEVPDIFEVSERLLTTQHYETKFKCFTDAAGAALRGMLEKPLQVLMQVAAYLRMPGRCSKQLETNNWRRMHGLPMRRKRRGWRGGNGKRADCKPKNADVS